MANHKRFSVDVGPGYHHTDVSYDQNEFEAHSVTGFGKGKLSVGAINAEANVIKHSNEIQFSRKAVAAMNRQEIGCFSVGAGPVKVKVGQNIDTGLKVNDHGMELKILGDGVKVGKDGFEAKLLGTGVTYTKDKVGAELLGIGFKAEESKVEIKVFGIGFELNF